MVNVKPLQTSPMPKVKQPKTPPTDYEKFKTLFEEIGCKYPTDYEKFKGLFKEIGCEYIIHLEPDRIYIEIDPISADDDLGVEFDRHGKFKRFVTG